LFIERFRSMPFVCSATLAQLPLYQTFNSLST
jgi:hypothetical protein